jgi:hypothetical protein
VAIDDLPLPVVSFLNVIGVPWPYLNEDTVSEFASLVRQFRAAVATTHEDATEAVVAITRTHVAPCRPWELVGGLSDVRCNSGLR